MPFVRNLSALRPVEQNKLFLFVGSIEGTYEMPSCFNIPRNFNLSSGFVKPSAFCSSVGQCWIRLFGFAQTSAIHIIDTPWVLDRWRSAGLRPFSAMTIVAELSSNIDIGT